MSEKHEPIFDAKNEDTYGIRWPNILPIVSKWNECAVNSHMNPASSAAIFSFMTYWMSFNLLFEETNFRKINNTIYYNFFAHNIGREDESYNYNFKTLAKNERCLYKKIQKKYTDNFCNHFFDSSYLADNPHKTKEIQNNIKNISKYIPFIGTHNDLTERQKILLYTDSIILDLKKSNIIDIMDKSAEIRKYPIVEGRTTYNELLSEYETQKRDLQDLKKSNILKNAEYWHRMIKPQNNCSEECRIMAYIFTIYQIRCNLFHGSKIPHDQRDESLVSEAAEIMKAVINSVLNKGEH